MHDGEPLHVVLVSYEFPPQFGGGIGTCTRILARALARRDHSVTVLTVGAEADATEPFPGGGSLRVVRLGEAPAAPGTLRSWWAWSALAADWLVREAPGADIIEFPDYRAEALAYLVQREARGVGEGGAGEGERAGACIIRLHTPLAVLNRYNASRRRDRALEAMEIEALLLADGVVSSSHALTREVRSLVPELGEVEFSRYGLENEADDGGGSLNADPAPPVGASDVVYVGRLEERKGVEVLARAAGAVLRACPRTTLHMVGGDTEWGPGEPSSRARIEALLAPLGESERARIVFHGALEPRRVREVVRAARICVFPSLFEAGPYTCLEAMALARPVIGTACSGMAEMIEDGAGGVLVPPGDADALAAAMIALLGRGDDDLAAMGERARRRVRERYSADAAAAEAESVYRRIIQRRRVQRTPRREPGALGAVLGDLRAMESEHAARLAALDAVAKERDEAMREATRLAAAWEQLRARVVELEEVRDRLWNEARQFCAEAQRLAAEWEIATARVRELSGEARRAEADLVAAQSERAMLRDRLCRLERAVAATQERPVFKILAKAGLLRRIGAEAVRHD